MVNHYSKSVSKVPKVKYAKIDDQLIDSNSLRPTNKSSSLVEMSCSNYEDVIKVTSLNEGRNI